jgi:hypothetical protein
MPNAFEGAAKADPPPVKSSVGAILTPWLGMVCLLILLTAILQPGLNSRTPSKRILCESNARQIALSLYSHADRMNHLPLASSQPFTSRPGSYENAHPAGYSWCVPILPYLDLQPLYNQWKLDSNDFQLVPLDPVNNRALTQVRIPLFYCPHNIDGFVDIKNAEYQLITNPDGTRSPPARGAYIAFASSHFTNATGLGELYESDAQSPFDGNGVMPFPRTPGDVGHGIALADIHDGLSHTLLFCETLETAYAAWCDGQAMWAVGAWPGNANVPTATGGPDGLLGWPDADVQSRISLGVGDDDDPALVYLPKSRYTAGHDRRWGPSSNHAGGVVMHAFADGRVEAISPDIDRNLYLRLISRDGGEAVTFP